MVKTKRPSLPSRKVRKRRIVPKDERRGSRKEKVRRAVQASLMASS